MQNKSKLFLALSAVLIVIACVVIAVVLLGGNPEKMPNEPQIQGNVENISGEPKNQGPAQYYEEEKLLTHGMYVGYDLFVDYKGETCKIADEKIISVASLETVGILPEKFRGSEHYFTIQGEEMMQVEYDTETKEVACIFYDLEGNEKGKRAVLKNYPGKIWKNLRASIYDVTWNDKYIFLRYPQKQRDLSVYRRDGTHVGVYANISIFDVDDKSNLYGVFQEQRGQVATLKKINIEKNKEEFSVNVFSGVIGVKLDSQQKNIYFMHTDGADVYSAKTGEFIRKSMRFGEDSSYLANALGKDFNQVNNFHIDTTDQEAIYIIRDVRKDGDFTVNLYRYTPVEGARPERSITLNVTIPYKMDFMEKIAQQFEMENKDVKVNLQYDDNSQSEYRSNLEKNTDKFTARILTNDIGDVVMTGGSEINYFNLFQSDAFTDLTEYLKSDASNGKLNQKVLDGIVVNGAIRGLPIAVNPNYIPFNKKLAEEMGLTISDGTIKWSEVLSLVKQIELGGKDGALLYSPAPREKHVEILDLLIANMPDLINLQNKTINLKQDWFIALLEQWKECLSSPSFINYQSQEKAVFGKIKTVQQSYAETLRQYAMYGIDGMHNRPIFGGELHDNMVGYTNMMFSINGRSENQELAWEFLSRMLSEDVQSDLFLLSGYPIDNSILPACLENAKQSWEEYPEIKYQAAHEDILQKLENIDIMYDMGSMKNDIYFELVKYFNDEITLEDALTAAEKALMIRLNE